MSEPDDSHARRRQVARERRKRLECFVAKVLEHLTYQQVKDAAVVATVVSQCPADDSLRPAIAEITRWLSDYEIERTRAPDYKPCGGGNGSSS